MIRGAVLGRIFEGELFTHPTAQQGGTKRRVVDGKTPHQFSPEGLSLPSRRELIKDGRLGEGVVGFSRTEGTNFA